MLAGTQADRDVLVEIYKCGVCTQTFGELEDLQDHVTQHKKDLTCTKCRKIFMSKEKFEVCRFFYVQKVSLNCSFREILLK